MQLTPTHTPTLHLHHPQSPSETEERLDREPGGEMRVEQEQDEAHYHQTGRRGESAGRRIKILSSREVMGKGFSVDQ